MNQKQDSNNVLQFPGPKKETTVSGQKPVVPPPAPPTTKRKTSKKTLAGTVLAIVLATGAVNRYAFRDAGSEAADLASLSSSGGRHIASIERFNWSRDSHWEKQLAERLASKETREPASAHIGRAATKEEQLRWGVLDQEKYTINYNPEERSIDSILLQDASSDPSYILDREKFLTEYGHLFRSAYETSKLKSVETTGTDKTVESYTLYDRENKVTGEVRFELDRHKRLLSLKVESTQI